MADIHKMKQESVIVNVIWSLIVVMLFNIIIELTTHEPYTKDLYVTIGFSIAIFIVTYFILSKQKV
jgi:hypothetical protein